MTHRTSRTSRTAVVVIAVLFAIMPTLSPRAQGASAGPSGSAGESTDSAQAGDASESAGSTAADEASAFNSDLDYAQVRRVVATRSSDGAWRFEVTVEHNDEGWDHYADLWQVVHPQTLEVYGERELLHPHDNEQPFTRSQSGIRIPDGQTTVRVRAQCNVHGFGGREVIVDLTTESGESYEVRR